MSNNNNKTIINLATYRQCRYLRYLLKNREPKSERVDVYAKALYDSKLDRREVSEMIKRAKEDSKYVPKLNYAKLAEMTDRLKAERNNSTVRKTSVKTSKNIKDALIERILNNDKITAKQEAEMLKKLLGVK